MEKKLFAAAYTFTISQIFCTRQKSGENDYNKIHITFQLVIKSIKINT